MGTDAFRFTKLPLLSSFCDPPSYGNPSRRAAVECVPRSFRTWRTYHTHQATSGFSTVWTCSTLVRTIGRAGLSRKILFLARLKDALWFRREYPPPNCVHEPSQHPPSSLSQESVSMNSRLCTTFSSVLAQSRPQNGHGMQNRESVPRHGGERNCCTPPQLGCMVNCPKTPSTTNERPAPNSPRSRTLGTTGTVYDMLAA